MIEVTQVSPVPKELEDHLVQAELPVEWDLPDNQVFPVLLANQDHLDLQDLRVPLEILV